MFIRFDTLTNVTDTHTDTRHTPHDGKGALDASIARQLFMDNKLSFTDKKLSMDIFHNNELKQISSRQNLRMHNKNFTLTAFTAYILFKDCP